MREKTGKREKGEGWDRSTALAPSGLSVYWVLIETPESTLCPRSGFSPVSGRGGGRKTKKRAVGVLGRSGRRRGCSTCGRQGGKLEINRARPRLPREPTAGLKHSPNKGMIEIRF